jgi:hypothetical protein
MYTNIHQEDGVKKSIFWVVLFIILGIFVFGKESLRLRAQTMSDVLLINSEPQAQIQAQAKIDASGNAKSKDLQLK